VAERATDSAASDGGDPGPPAEDSDSEASTADTVRESCDEAARPRSGQQCRRTRASRRKAHPPQEARRREAARRAAESALWQLADDAEGPVLLLDLERVSKTLRKWRQQLPRVSPSFVVGTGANRDLLELLHQSGSGFSCATAQELRCALSSGVEPESVFLSNTSTPRSHLRYARANGVELVSFDSEAQLQKVAADFPCARLLLHVACEACGSEAAGSGALARPGRVAAFGACRSEWNSLLLRARELNLQVAGIAVHHGTSFGRPAVSPDSTGAGGFSEALGTARHVVNLATALGFDIRILNIGSILPPLGPPRVCDPNLLCVAAQLETHFPAADFPTLRVLAEPGHLLLGRGGASLLTRARSEEATANWGLDHDGHAQRGPAVGALIGCTLARGVAAVEPELLQPRPRARSEAGFLRDAPRGDGQAWLLWRDLDAYVAAAGFGSGEPMQAVHHSGCGEGPCQRAGPRSLPQPACP